MRCEGRFWSEVEVALGRPFILRWNQGRKDGPKAAMLVNGGDGAGDRRQRQFVWWLVSQGACAGGRPDVRVWKNCRDQSLEKEGTKEEERTNLT